MMEMCGDAETRLASELMQYEMNIEKEILDPLNQLAEVQTNIKDAFNICHLLTTITLHNKAKMIGIGQGGGGISFLGRAPFCHNVICALPRNSNAPLMKVPLCRLCIGQNVNNNAYVISLFFSGGYS